MRIIFTVSAMTSGGAERVVSRISNFLIHKGHNVSIIMVSETNCDSFYDLDPKIKLIALCDNMKRKSKPLRRVKSLRKKIKELLPDVVVAFLPHICIYTYFALIKTGIPLVVSERNDPNQYNFFYKTLLRHVFRKADACVFQTNNALRWYKKKQNDTNLVIYNPAEIHNSLFSKTKKQKKIVYVGSNSTRKNIPMMLQSFEMFFEKHNDYRLYIYGKGFNEDYLKIYVKTDTLANISIMGENNDWYACEKDAALFLLSSNYEGMSNSLLEAASLGINCIATDCPIGGSKEIALHYKNVVLVPIGDSYTMYQMMEKYFDSNEFNVQFIPDEFQVDNICKKWLSLLVLLISYKKKYVH